jgi:hypothetical protein
MRADLGLQIQMPGFAAVSESVEVHSSIPTEHMIRVKVTGVNEFITVNARDSLSDYWAEVLGLEKRQVNERPELDIVVERNFGGMLQC